MPKLLLMYAPPPTRTVPAPQAAVTLAPVLAAVGPDTLALRTVIVGLVGSVLQTAKTDVVFVPPPPPFSPTAVHEPGLVPDVTGLPVASSGSCR